MGGVQSNQKNSEHTVIPELSRENGPERPAHRSDFTCFYAFFHVLIHIPLSTEGMSTGTSEVGIDNMFVGEK